MFLVLKPVMDFFLDYQFKHICVYVSYMLMKLDKSGNTVSNKSVGNINSSA